MERCRLVSDEGSGMWVMVLAFVVTVFMSLMSILLSVGSFPSSCVKPLYLLDFKQLLVVSSETRDMRMLCE